MTSKSFTIFLHRDYKLNCWGINICMTLHFICCIQLSTWTKLVHIVAASSVHRGWKPWRGRRNSVIKVKRVTREMSSLPYKSSPPWSAVVLRRGVQSAAECELVHLCKNLKWLIRHFWSSLPAELRGTAGDFPSHRGLLRAGTGHHDFPTATTDSDPSVHSHDPILFGWHLRRGNSTTATFSAASRRWDLARPRPRHTQPPHPPFDACPVGPLLLVQSVLDSTPLLPTRFTWIPLLRALAIEAVEESFVSTLENVAPGDVY